MKSIGLHNHHGFLLRDVEVPEGPERAGITWMASLVIEILKWVEYYCCKEIHMIYDEEPEQPIVASYTPYYFGR